MKWTQQIENLKKLQGKPDSIKYIKTYMRAQESAGTWDCCSLAEKMKLINPKWPKLYNYDQIGILEEYDKLEQLGHDFCDNIDNENYDEAMETHTLIQAYEVDEDKIRKYMDVCNLT